MARAISSLPVPLSQLCFLSEHGKACVNHLHVYVGIDRRSATIGKMLVLVTNGKRTPRSIYNLNSAAEIRCELKRPGSRGGHIFTKIEKTPSYAAERLDTVLPSEIELHSDRRKTGTVNALPHILHSCACWNTSESVD